MSNLEKQDNKIINPFNTVYETITQPKKELGFFYEHSFDDFTEDLVTAFGLWLSLKHLPVKISAGLFIPIYFAVKKTADYAGEFVEQIVKSDYQYEQNIQSYDNITSSLIDDAVEDTSKAVCLGYNVMWGVGPVEILRRAYQWNMPVNNPAAQENSIIKYVNAGIAAYSYIHSYSQCNEQANAHGNWAAQQYDEIYEEVIDYLSTLSMKTGSSENEEMGQSSDELLSSGTEVSGDSALTHKDDEL